MTWEAALLQTFIIVVVFCGLFELPRRWFRPKRSDDNEEKDGHD